MINLTALYGDKIFNRKRSLARGRYMGFVGGTLFDFIIAFAIVKVFEIRWEYAVIKVYGVLLLYALFKPVMTWPFDRLNYWLFLSKAMASEMNHYLYVFPIILTADNMSTYDDFLLSASFDESLAADLRVLAGMTYAGIVNVVSTNPRLENMYYKTWCNVISDFTKLNPKRVIRLDI